MKWHPAGTGWTGHMHIAHAIHMHPVHWLQEHPTVSALLLAALLTLLVLGIFTSIDTSIRPEMFNPIEVPTAYPFEPAV